MNVYVLNELAKAHQQELLEEVRESRPDPRRAPVLRELRESFARRLVHERRRHRATEIESSRA